ncbi:pectinesterase inhibitor-like [Carica papaya]|uniref:pectinesterase inhibitor-like n=1 Tax=Carica papaya TaxID=3649 RepID=UPI000B8CE4F0|nr:pectinesterase inhibitor-like [Carica papaya]
MGGSSLKWSIMIMFIFLFSNPINGRFSTQIDKATLDQICVQTKDEIFCDSVLGSDPRTRTADMKGMALIAISLSIIQINEVTTLIPELLSGTTDPVAKQRLQTCNSDYEAALVKFQEAYRSAGAASYSDVINSARDGVDKTTQCENRYKTSPVGSSPLSQRNQNMINLSEIISIIVKMIQGS